MKTITCSHRYGFKSMYVHCDDETLISVCCTKCSDSMEFMLNGFQTTREGINHWKKKYAPEEFQSPPRDVQRTKLYTWERRDVWAQFSGVTNYGAKSPMTPIEVKAFVRKVFKDYGFPMPSIYWGKGNTASWSWTRKRLNFPSWSRCTPILVHEIAHALNDYINGRAIQWHGKEYVDVYITLLAQYGGLNENELRQKAFLYGLKIEDKFKRNV